MKELLPTYLVVIVSGEYRIGESAADLDRMIEGVGDSPGRPVAAQRENRMVNSNQ